MLFRSKRFPTRPDIPRALAARADPAGDGFSQPGQWLANAPRFPQKPQVSFLAGSSRFLLLIRAGEASTSCDVLGPGRRPIASEPNRWSAIQEQATRLAPTAPPMVGMLAAVRGANALAGRIERVPFRQGLVAVAMPAKPCGRAPRLPLLAWRDSRRARRAKAATARV